MNRKDFLILSEMIKNNISEVPASRLQEIYGGICRSEPDPQGTQPSRFAKISFNKAF